MKQFDLTTTTNDLIDSLSEYGNYFVAFHIECADEYGVNKVELDEDGDLCLSDEGDGDNLFCEDLIAELSKYESKNVYACLSGDNYMIAADEVEFDDDSDDEEDYEIIVTVREYE